jgi:glutathione S-transferase
MGDAFTVADAYAYTIVSWAYPLRVVLTPYPSLETYLTRVARRPRIREALIAEGLVEKAA